jgi:hypothetical protein
MLLGIGIPLFSTSIDVISALSGRLTKQNESADGQIVEKDRL